MRYVSTHNGRRTGRELTSRPARVRRGFTLIEAAIVTVIVGVGIVGLMHLLAAGSMANADSAELTTAVYLANNIDELLQGKSYATLKSTYDNQTYTTPIHAMGNTPSGFPDWPQLVSAKSVRPDL